MLMFSTWQVSSSKWVQKRQIRMDKDSQVFAEQAQQAMDFVREEKIEKPKFNSMLLTKMRTTPWTFDSLTGKATTLRAQQGKPSLVAGGLLGTSPASSLGVAQAMAPPSERPGQRGTQGDVEDPEQEEGEEEEGMEDDDDDSEKGSVAAASTMAGGGLNTHAIMASMSVVGGTKRKAGVSGIEASEAAGSGKSPGAKQARMKVDANGTPILEADKVVLVERRTNSASIVKILNGDPMGREINWCSKSRDAFRASGEPKYADQLDEHFQLCKHAELLADSSLARLARNQMDVAIKEIQDNG